MASTPEERAARREEAAKYIAGLVEKAKVAQAVAEKFTQEDVDLITAAVTYNLTKPEKAQKFAEMLVEESGMGIAEDKVGKIYGKVWGSYLMMKDKKSVGKVDDAPSGGPGITAYAKPMGVVAGIMPVTNGEATPIVKSNMALKTRNAIILAPHPKCKKLNVEIVAEIRATLKKLGYPEDLVQTCDAEHVNLETSQELMKQCDFILATGGEALVETAYSSGTPAIGVGVGNCCSIVTGKTPMDDVAEMICKSKAFDNATSCSTENNILVFESCFDEFVEAMKAHGAYMCTPEEAEKLKVTMWPNTPNDHVLNRAIVAQNCETIGKLAGIPVPAGTRCIMAMEEGAGLDHPFAGEKLSPVSGVQVVKDLDAAIDRIQDILNYQGKGHSAGIHTNDPADVDAIAQVLPVTKIAVNQPQCLTNSGGWDTGFPVSMTLGCGTWGGNSVSHNATYKDLLNYTYVSERVPNWKPEKVEDFIDAAVIAKVDA
ncbi:MAG: aldehyde dehydrogenase family protein [Firmicutes bacterium]|nr:aldehyde dehydrogenase family protein [Bacillota bacterium]